MSGPTFTRRTGEYGCHAEATLRGGETVTVNATLPGDRLELWLFAGKVRTCMVFTAAEARAVAAELLAAADARESCWREQGR